MRSLKHAGSKGPSYLGASEIGAACCRALQAAEDPVIRRMAII